MDIGTLKPFKNLQHSEDLVVIDWIGGITVNLDENNNPLFDCYFTPLTLDTTSSPPMLRRIRSKQFRAGLTTGYMVNTYIGQCFRNGRLADIHEWPQLETVQINCDTSQLTPLNEKTLADLKLDTGSWIVNRKLFRPASQTTLKIISSKLLYSDHPKWTHHIKSHPDPFDIIIPETELIRFYYTSSEYSYKSVLTDAYANDKLEVDVINTIHETPRHIPETDTHRFVYRHGYKQTDALALGRILFEPEEHALKSVQRIKKLIDADRINHKLDTLGYPRTHFPFLANTTLTLQGRRLKKANGYGYCFLVSKIQSCSGPFPFRNLSFCDEISQGGEAAPAGSPAAFPGQNTVLKGPGHSSRAGQSITDASPNSRAERLHAQLGERVFTQSNSINLKYNKARDSTYTSSKKTYEIDGSLSDASTGNAKSSGQSIPQTITARHYKASTVSPNLDSFIQIIESLKRINPDYSYKTLIVGKGYSDKSINYSFFPLVPCQKRTSTMRQFSYLNSSRSLYRRFICVEILAGTKYIYLFECERRFKQNHKKQLEPRDHYPILLIRKTGFQRCIPDDFLSMLHQTVIRRTWPLVEELHDLLRDTTVHGRGAQSINDMTSRVLDLLKRNMNTK